MMRIITPTSQINWIGIDSYFAAGIAPLLHHRTEPHLRLPKRPSLNEPPRDIPNRLRSVYRDSVLFEAGDVGSCPRCISR